MTEMPYDSFLAIVAAKYGPITLTREEIEASQDKEVVLVVRLNGSPGADWESVTILVEEPTDA